jgi:hypothetical protein
MPDQTKLAPEHLVHVVEDRQRRVRAQVWESWAQDGKVHHSITTSGFQNGWIQGVVHSPEQFMAAFDCAIAAERWVTNRRQELSRHMVDGRVIPDCSLHEAPPSVSVLRSEKPQRGPDTDRGSEMNENYLKDKQGRPLSVRFDGQDHWVRVERYAEGNRPALLLVPKASPEEYIVVTVNSERGQVPRSGELLIKNYSENSGVLEALEAAGVVKRTGRTVQAGYAALVVVRPLVEIPGKRTQHDRTGDERATDKARAREHGPGHPVDELARMRERKRDRGGHER